MRLVYFILKQSWCLTLLILKVGDINLEVSVHDSTLEGPL
jgi:hypothetical protein